MYKKIKNSSFMNLIWFIIAIFPILLLLIYSSNFIFNKQTNGYKINNLINLQNDFVEVTDENGTYFENNNIYYYTMLSEQNYTSNYFIFNYSTSYSTNPFYLDFDDQNLDGLDYNVYIELVNLSNSNDIKLIYDIYYHNNINSGELSTGTIQELNGTFAYGGDNFSIFLDGDTIPDNEFIYNFTLKIFISFEHFSKDLIKEQNNWFEVYINNNFYDYLISIKNTIQTNGFISSAFLNLSTFFGVNNVYYSLACYYIEYLLVIALLHLAFDVLYMLPNICHKFMEKIGGERD